MIINSAFASDIEKENYWKELILKANKIGENIDLKADDQDFFALYNKQNLIKEKGSVILLHDKGGHPDTKNVIRPLRIQLTDYGWNTFSIQMPLNTSKLVEKEDFQLFFQQANARLDSAITYLKDEKNQKTIFLVAYGENSSIVLDYMQNNPRRMVKGMVLIAMPSISEEITQKLEKIKLPILDIYGSEDYDSVTLAAPQRQSAARRGGNIFYAQRKLNFADHFFYTEINLLIKRVHSWMVSTIKK